MWETYAFLPSINIAFMSTSQRPLPFEHASLLSLHNKHRSVGPARGWMSERYREDLEVREPYYVHSRAEFNSQPRYPRSRRMRVMLPSLSKARSSRPLLQHAPSQRSLLLGFDPFDTSASSPALFGPTRGFRSTHQRHGSGPITVELGRDLLGDRKWTNPANCIMRSKSTAEIDATRCHFARSSPLFVIPKKEEQESVQQRVILRRFKKPVPMAPEILFLAPPTRQRARLRPKRRKLVAKEGRQLPEEPGNEEGGGRESEDWESEEEASGAVEKEWWESDSDPEPIVVKIVRATTPTQPRLYSASLPKRPSSCLSRYQVPPHIKQPSPAFSTASLNPLPDLQGWEHGQSGRTSIDRIEPVDNLGDQEDQDPGTSIGQIGPVGNSLDKEEMDVGTSGGNITIARGTGKPDILAFVTGEDASLLGAGDRREADTEDYPSVSQARRTVNSDTEEPVSTTFLSQEDNHPLESSLLQEATVDSPSPADPSNFIDTLRQDKAGTRPGALPGITEESMLAGSVGTSTLSPRTFAMPQTILPKSKLHISLERRTMESKIRGSSREGTWAVGQIESEREEEPNLSFHSDIPLGSEEREAEEPSRKPWRPMRNSLPLVRGFPPPVPLLSQSTVFPTTSTSISNSPQNTAREPPNEPPAAVPGKPKALPLELVSRLREQRKDTVKKTEAEATPQAIPRPVSAELKGSPKVKPSLHPMKKASPLLGSQSQFKEAAESQLGNSESQIPVPVPVPDPFEELILRISTSVLSIINQMIVKDPSRIAKKLEPLVAKTVVQQGKKRAKINWEPSAGNAVSTGKREEEKQKTQTIAKPQTRSVRKPLSLAVKPLVKSVESSVKRVAKRKNPTRSKAPAKARASSPSASDSEYSGSSSPSDTQPALPYGLSDYELGRMTLMHMLAADLLKSASETPEPSESFEDLQDPDSDTDITARRNRGFDVQRRLQSMVESVRMTQQAGLMVAIDSDLRPRKPPPSRETVLPEEVVVDRRNREDIRQVLRFRSKIATLPTNSTLLSAQEAHFCQFESHQLLPEEVKNHYIRIGRQRRHDRGRIREVSLKARKEYTFSGLEERYYLNKYADKHQYRSKDLPSIRIGKEDLGAERVYGHMKHASAELLFPVGGKVRYDSLESSIEELEQVCSTHRSLL